MASLAVGAFELAGAALALTISTALVLVRCSCCCHPRCCGRGCAGSSLGAAMIGGLALVAFGVAGAVLPAEPAAVVGAVAFCAMLAAVRGLGLRQAWGYLRTLD